MEGSWVLVDGIKLRRRVSNSGCAEEGGEKERPVSKEGTTHGEMWSAAKMDSLPGHCSGHVRLRRQSIYIRQGT
jgi:hypothetical protein